MRVLSFESGPPKSGKTFRAILTALIKISQRPVCVCFLSKTEYDAVNNFSMAGYVCFRLLTSQSFEIDHRDRSISIKGGGVIRFVSALDENLLGDSVVIKD